MRALSNRHDASTEAFSKQWIRAANRRFSAQPPQPVPPLSIRFSSTGGDVKVRLEIDGDGQVRLRRGRGLFADISVAGDAPALESLLVEGRLSYAESFIAEGRISVQGKVSSFVPTLMYLDSFIGPDEETERDSAEHGSNE